MTDNNVIPLQREPEDAIWQCFCGCTTFKAHLDTTLECASCGEIMREKGEWIKNLPSPSGPVAEKQLENVITFQKTAMMTLRDLVAEGAEMALILAVRDTGVTTLWGKNIETEAQLEWLENQFDKARSVLVKGPRS